MGKERGWCKGCPQSLEWITLWMMHIEYASSVWSECSLKCLNLTELVIREWGWFLTCHVKAIYI
jgi:hypothetical protein